MNRRQFLRAMGLTTGALSLGSLGRPARADTGGVKRFVLFYTNNGVVQDRWAMPGRTDTTWSEALPSVSSAYSDCLVGLAPVRQQVMVAKGFGLVSAEQDNVAAGTRHETGNIHSVTGNWAEMVGNFPMPTSPSIDQLIADHIGSPEQFRSMEWGVGNTYHEVSYRDRRVILPTQYDLEAIHARLFGGVAVSGAAQASLLDAVRGRYTALSRRLGTTDRAKVEAHQQLLWEIQVRQNGLAERQLACENPNDWSLDGGGYEEVFAQQVQLAQVAFSCDLTRVLTLNVGDHGLKAITGEAGDIHDAYAHDIRTSERAADIVTTHYQQLVRHFVDLVQGLDSVADPHGDGAQSLLDNTVVLWLNELGDSTHSFDQLPVVIAGGSAFSDFRLGQYVHLPATTPVQAWSLDGLTPSMGVPHQRLLVTVAQQLGLSVDQVGLDTLSTLEGELDCRGPVLELLGSE
jgi:hypothetical protein